MRETQRLHGFWRIAIACVLITYSVACTHMPSGEKAFKSFEGCFAANLGLATVGGIGVGVLSAKLIGGATGNASAAKTAGIAAGIAAGAMIAMHAWKKCAAVYNTSEVVTPPTVRPTAATTARSPALTLDRLDMHVDGNENTAPKAEFSYSFATANPATKDIKAKYRHRVEIVRFKVTDDNKMILANSQGEPLRDKAGKDIPIEAAAHMPREQLTWEPIAEDGREDYVEDVVIQQGQGATIKHTIHVPPRAQLPLPLPVPMRYSLTIEADNMTTTRTVDFFILGTSSRPKRYASSAAAMKSPVTRSLSAPSSTLQKDDKAAITTRRTPLFNAASTQRKVLATLPKGAQVSINERTTAIINNRPEDWANVTDGQGRTGWLPANLIQEVR